MNVILITEVFSLYLVFILLHEAGHILAAKVLKLKIDKIGFRITPLPHIYVAVLDVPGDFIKYIYLFSGAFVTVCLFTSFVISGLLYSKSIYLAISACLILDFNPFYSDFTHAFDNDYKFSPRWYIHFLFWAVLVFLLTAPNSLRSHFILN